MPNSEKHYVQEIAIISLHKSGNHPKDLVPVTEVNNIQPWFALVEVHYWVAENSKWLEPETTKEAWKAM